MSPGGAPGEERKRELRITLIGTIAAGPQGAAIFSMEKGSRLLSPGADLGDHLGADWRGVVLEEIRRRAAVFRGRGHEWKVELREGGGAGTGSMEPGGEVVPPPAVASGSGDPAAPPGEVIHLRRDDVEERMDNLAFLVTQMSLQPYFKKGKPAGVRISRIRPGSMVDKLGVENGDVLKSVEGKEVRTLQDATRLGREVRSRDRVRVGFLRGEKLVEQVYKISD